MGTTISLILPTRVRSGDVKTNAVKSSSEKPYLSDYKQMDEYWAELGRFLRTHSERHLEEEQEEESCP